MALDANSYGDTGETAKLVPRYANTSFLFDANTRPALTTVESETDQISAAVNLMLLQEGFSIPVSQVTAKLMLDGFVNKMSAEIAHGVNGAGRFGAISQSKKGAKGAYLMILEDTKLFIQENAIGFERLGVPRPNRISTQIGFRDTDLSGDTSSVPLFEREAFGEAYKEWDRSR